MNQLAMSKKGGLLEPLGGEKKKKKRSQRPREEIISRCGAGATTEVSARCGGLTFPKKKDSYYCTQ